MNIYKNITINGSEKVTVSHATTEDIAYLFAFDKIVAWLKVISFEETKTFTIKAKPYDYTLIDIQADGFVLRGVGNNRSVRGMYKVTYRPDYDIVKDYEEAMDILPLSFFTAIKELVNNWKNVKQAILDEVAHIAEIMNFEA